MTQKDSPQILNAKKDDTDIKPTYTKAEEQYAKKCLDLLIQMREERDQKRSQFNDMTWGQWDDRQIKADLSYIPPAKNKGETRIVTGMTRQKDSTLVSTVLSYEFEPNCTAFDDKDMIINHIGEEAEDMVRKSRQLEDYDSKRALFYRGIISRGTYYAMHLYIERYGYEKVLPAEYTMGKVTGVEWTERLKKTFSGCETFEIDPKKVYMSSMSEFFIQNQDAVAVVDRLSYEEAESLYGTWERWANVPKNFASMGAELTSEPNSIWSPYWAITPVQKHEVERVILMMKKTNELQIFLNGVMLLPVVQVGMTKNQTPIVSGFPLTAISPSGMYPLVKGDYDPVTGFAISRGVPANMSVDQESQDMFLKLMIEKTKQSFNPSMVNNSGRLLSRQSFMSGTINDDIKKDSVFPLFDPTGGVTAGEFSFYQLLKGQMEEKSVTKQYEGGETTGMTATQVLENKKQNVLKMGLALDGIMRFERDLAILQWYSIIANWTLAEQTNIDKTKKSVEEIFRTMTVEKRVKGSKMRKVIKFTKDVEAMKQNDPEGFKIHGQEEKYKKETGIEVRYSFINPEGLRKLKATWNWTISPNDKKDDILARLMFTQNIQDAINFFGVDSLKVDNLKQRFSIVIKEDYDNWFKNEQEVATAMLEQAKMSQTSQGRGGSDINNPIQKPNLKQATSNY